MSIELEISRIQKDKSAIRTKLVELGLANSEDNLDRLATQMGTIINNGAVNARIQEGATYTIPKGYHNGSGTVQGVAGGGNYNLQTKTVTPTELEQAISPDEGYYGLSSVTVKAIPTNYKDVSGVTATADTVLAKKAFVDAKGKTLIGTMPNNGDTSKELDGLKTNTITIPKGYTTGGTITLSNSIELKLKEI